MTSGACVPKLYLWREQMLFLGASYIPYREHKVVSDKLIVSITGNIIIHCADGSELVTRSCLVKTGTAFNKSLIETRDATIAIYYLNTLSQDYSALASAMPEAREGMRYGHPQEGRLIDQLIYIRDVGLTPCEAFDALRDLIMDPALQAVVFKEFDPRIVTVVHRLRATVRDNRSVPQFAAEVNLSESRLEKLFKEQIGQPITTYRLRYRVYVGIIFLARGCSVTEAALVAGFASSAHFSKSFSTINGVAPSAAFFKPPFLEVLIADDVLETP